ncbi:MAG: hypothetical protein D6805_09485 [Planctomycetota bacterium]|nr:MAG: hypothetical protein D6805_09485 [Planctomycetota bacterium]
MEQDRERSEAVESPEEYICDRYIDAWEAAGIAAALNERGMRALEEEDWQRAYTYFELALQYQPHRRSCRVALSKLQKNLALREEIFGEIFSLFPEEAKEKTGSFTCPECSCPNPEGVRVCRCGREFAKEKSPKWKSFLPHSSKSPSLLGMWWFFLPIFLGILAILGLLLFRPSSFSRPVPQRISDRVSRSDIREISQIQKENQVLLAAVKNQVELLESQVKHFKEAAQGSSKPSSLHAPLALAEQHKEIQALLANIYNKIEQIHSLLTGLRVKNLRQGKGKKSSSPKRSNSQKQERSSASKSSKSSKND